jgi:hypothetical protein
MIPRIPNPSRLIITIAISHVVLKKSAIGWTKQAGGGSAPSSGNLPSGVTQRIADSFR